jgi:hypothetical protein
MCRCRSDGAVLAVERDDRIYLHATADLLSQKAGALVEYSVGTGALTSLSWSKNSSSSGSKNRLLAVSSSGAAAIITPDSASPLAAIPPTTTEQLYTCGDWSTDGSAVALGAQGGGVAVFTVSSSSSSSAVTHVLSKEASHPLSDDGVNVVDVVWLADSSTLYVMYSVFEIEDSNAQGTFMRVERGSSSSSSSGGRITALTPVLYDQALCCPERDNFDKYRLYCAQVSTTYLTITTTSCVLRSVPGVMCVTIGL